MGGDGEGARGLGHGPLAEGREGAGKGMGMGHGGLGLPMSGRWGWWVGGRGRVALEKGWPSKERGWGEDSGGRKYP